MSDESTPIELESAQIERYLLAHPEFFHQHLSLLENLSIPHPSGNAVSLVSKQLEIFRNKHHELESQLTGLIEIAKDNDLSLNRMHQLTLALMVAQSIDEVVVNLERVFVDCFLTDFSAIRIVKRNDQQVEHDVLVRSDDEGWQHFDSEMHKNQPKCCKPTLPQAQFLFADKAKEVKSCAIIPMVFAEVEGVIGIGSRDESRFHYGLGSLFLTQISEVVATRLISLVNIR